MVLAPIPHPTLFVEGTASEPHCANLNELNPWRGTNLRRRGGDTFIRDLIKTTLKVREVRILTIAPKTSVRNVRTTEKRPSRPNESDPEPIANPHPDPVPSSRKPSSALTYHKLTLTLTLLLTLPEEEKGERGEDLAVLGECEEVTCTHSDLNHKEVIRGHQLRRDRVLLIGPIHLTQGGQIEDRFVGDGVILRGLSAIGDIFLIIAEGDLDNALNVFRLKVLGGLREETKAFTPLVQKAALINGKGTMIKCKSSFHFHTLQPFNETRLKACITVALAKLTKGIIRTLRYTLGILLN